MSNRGRDKTRMPFNPNAVREKIRAIKLIQRLHAHIFDGLELSLSQVRAIDILLKKTVPDLTRTLISADINVRYVAHLPDVLSQEDWVRKYGDKQDVLTIEGPEDGKENGQAGGPAANKILQ